MIASVCRHFRFQLFQCVGSVSAQTEQFDWEGVSDGDRPASALAQALPMTAGPGRLRFENAVRLCAGKPMNNLDPASLGPVRVWPKQTAILESDLGEMERLECGNNPIAMQPNQAIVLQYPSPSIDF